MYVGKTFVSGYTCVYITYTYMLNIKMYVREMYMSFTSKLSFQKPAFFKQNSVHECDRNRRKKELSGISVTQPIFLLKSK